jgi:DNA-binding CsgD family transcriptional regulator
VREIQRSVWPAGFEELDASRSRRLESRIRRCVRAASASGWAVGIFDSDCLLAFDTSSPQPDHRAAVTLLSMVPLPASLPVALKAAPSRETIPAALGTAVALSNGLSVAFVLVLRKSSESAWMEAAEAMQQAVGQIAEEIADLNFTAKDQRLLAAPDAPQAFFLLSPQLEVELQWYGQDAACAAIARLSQPEGGRLPLLLERAVRRLTISWNFSRLGTCAAGAAAPINGLILRVVPMQRTGICIGVFLNQYAPLERVGAASSAFRISSREREVLHALFSGASIADIAVQLGLAESTVNDHIARMIAKTNSRNRIEMAARLLGWPAVRAEASNGGHSSPAEDRSTLVHGSDERPRGHCSWQYDVASSLSRQAAD